MNLKDALKNETNKTLTKNGALALKSTFNSNLDYFTQISMYKKDIGLGFAYFKEAYQEDPMLAMKNLFYTRNIRGLGQGLRDITRLIYHWLAQNHMMTMKANLKLVGFYGRMDDYYAFVDTPLEANAFAILRDQILEDMNNDHPSITAKWLASINTSNCETRRLGRLTAKYLGMSYQTYRKTLSFLRKRIDVTEVKMCNKEFDKINYEHVPSKAMLNYRNAFLRNDYENYKKYLELVNHGEKKINSKTLYPYDIMNKGRLNTWRTYLKIETDETLEAQWKALPNYVEGETATLVVADSSGSMEGNPLNVAISLALYFASRNKGIWKDKLITFSSKPSFVDLSNAKTLKEQVERIPALYSNTNIRAVFELILNSAINHEVPQEEMVENVVIVSDMQFDIAQDKNDKYYADVIKEMYENTGYKAPNLTFWNVNERFNPLNHAKFNDQKVRLVSGFSPSLFKEIVTNESVTPLDTMLDILNNEIFSEVKVVD